MALRQQPVILSKCMAWLPLGFAITAVIGFAYVAVQQDLRQSANDPQIQIAEDVVRQLSRGATPKEVIPSTTVDIANSLAPYIIVYTNDGVPVASSGLLDGELPRVPIGVIRGAHNSGMPSSAITWQPTPSVRQAIVVTGSSDVAAERSVVVVGRSLREVEIREQQLGLMAIVAWMVAMFGSLMLSFVVGQASVKRSS